jgi:hypothetical protein
MYDHFTKDDADNSYQHIWKAKFPYKIKILHGWLKTMQYQPKIIWRKENGRGTQYVCFVIRWKQSATYFSSVLMPGVFGGLWLHPWELLRFLGILSSIESRFKVFYPKGRKYIILAMQQSVGPSGNVGTRLCLTRKW